MEQPWIDHGIRGAKRVQRENAKLSRRQIEVLTCIHIRRHLYGGARFIDLVGDIGVSGNTLTDHLDALAKRGMIPPSPYMRRKDSVATYRYKNHYGQIELTQLGEEKVQGIKNELHISANDSQISALAKIRGMFQTKTQHHGYKRERRSEFSDAFNELIRNNPTEPVISSVGMYTELDSQLGLLATSNNELYLRLSKTKLNLPIRNGRIASMIVPVALRQQMSINQMQANLEHSWHWFRTVNDNTIDRYFDESSSMGLIEINNGVVKSCKPSTSTTIEWLASKTLPTFLNAVPNIPKAAILAFRESFAYPTKEEFLNPNDSGADLEWAQHIYDAMSNKDLYREIISDTLSLMVDQARIMIEHPESGRIIPRTILRRLNQAEDLHKAFDQLLKLANEKNPTATLLLIITAQPGITYEELWRKITSDRKIFIKYDELVDAIRQLIGRGLIHSAVGSQTRLYAFTQIPYVVQTDSAHKNEINAILKGVNPSLLAKIEETMYTPEDKIALQNTLEKLTAKKVVQFDALHDEYGKEFERKMIRLSEYLSPFVSTEHDLSGLKVSNEGLASIVLDITRYSVLTGNDSLNEYATLLSDLVTKDTDFKSRLVQSAQSIEDTFLDRGIKM